MRALQVSALDGPDAVVPAEVPVPAPGDGVLIDVHAAGVAFPDLLQTRGLYQRRPELPFVPGMEAAGTVRAAPAGSGLRPGDRVAAFTRDGAFAEVTVAPAHLTFALPDALDFAEGAALVLNTHTAAFALVTRGRLQAGETVLVHGAAGGVGTAALQVARGLGARTIAVVSSDEKADVARRAGADDVVRSDGAWLDEVRGGVDLVVDPVGGDRFTDSLRSLRPGRPGPRRRLHRRLDPRGEGQPAAAHQHGGRRRGLGRMGEQPRRRRTRDRGARDAPRGGRRGPPARRRAAPAGARRRRAAPHRAARRARQDRARRALTRSGAYGGRRISNSDSSTV